MEETFLPKDTLTVHEISIVQIILFELEIYFLLYLLGLSLTTYWYDISQDLLKKVLHLGKEKDREIQNILALGWQCGTASYYSPGARLTSWQSGSSLLEEGWLS